MAACIKGLSKFVLDTFLLFSLIIAMEPVAQDRGGGVRSVAWACVTATWKKNGRIIVYGNTATKEGLASGSMHGAKKYMKRRMYKEGNYEATVCKNLKYKHGNNSEHGWFICPMESQPDEIKYCCVDDGGKKCCRFWDANTVTVSFGCILGVASVIAFVKYCGASVCKSIKKRYRMISRHLANVCQRDNAENIRDSTSPGDLRFSDLIEMESTESQAFPLVAYSSPPTSHVREYIDQNDQWESTLQPYNRDTRLETVSQNSQSTQQGRHGTGISMGSGSESQFDPLAPPSYADIALLDRLHHDQEPSINTSTVSSLVVALPRDQIQSSQDQRELVSISHDPPPSYPTRDRDEEGDSICTPSDPPPYHSSTPDPLQREIIRNSAAAPPSYDSLFGSTDV